MAARAGADESAINATYHVLLSQAISVRITKRRADDKGQRRIGAVVCLPLVVYSQEK
jgi:hypothetical protein